VGTGIFLIGTLTLSLLFIYFQYSIVYHTNEKAEQYVTQQMKNSVLSCRKKVKCYITSCSLPYTFDIPIQQICGRYFYAEKKDCDDYFCTYEVSFGKFKETARPAFRITKEQLSSYVEGKNVEKLLALAKALKNYQDAFPDAFISNHFTDLGDTSGYKSVENYSSFFEELKTDWKDLYYDKLGYSSFYICTTNGTDCTVNGIECKLKYVSPYTGKVKEITVTP